LICGEQFSTTCGGPFTCADLHNAFGSRLTFSNESKHPLPDTVKPGPAAVVIHRSRALSMSPSLDDRQFLVATSNLKHVAYMIKIGFTPLEQELMKEYNAANRLHLLFIQHPECEEMMRNTIEEHFTCATFENIKARVVGVLTGEMNRLHGTKCLINDTLTGVIRAGAAVSVSFSFNESGDYELELYVDTANKYTSRMYKVSELTIDESVLTIAKVVIGQYSSYADCIRDLRLQGCKDLGWLNSDNFTMPAGAHFTVAYHTDRAKSDVYCDVIRRLYYSVDEGD